MTYYYFIRHRFANYASQFYCYCIYCVVGGIMFLLSWETRTEPLLFELILFSWGWLTWTFVEYMLHRFWMHSPRKTREHKDTINHQYHHTHPTEIKVTSLQRMVLALGFVVLAVVSAYVNSYLFIGTGIYFGFVGYTFMHLILHQKWSAKIFRRLHEYHIYHHCKFPNRCFGVSIVWWDVIFRTTPPAQARLSERIVDFYFGKIKA